MSEEIVNEQVEETLDAEETTTEAEAVSDDAEVVVESDDVPVEPLESDEEEVEAEPAYQPNYAYKASNEEREFDEWIRPAITSPEVEQQVRELYERSVGLDSVKSRLEESTSKYSEIKSKYDTVHENLNRIDGYLKEGNLGQFLHELQIPKEQIMKYALEQAKIQQMPEEQRQVYEQREQERVRLAELEQQNQQLQQQQMTQQELQVSNEIDTILASSELQPVVQAFNSRMGDPNAFRNEVLSRGRMHYYNTNGGNMTVRQAVEQVVGMVGGVEATQAPAQQAYGAQATQPLQATAPARKPVIPNVSGKGSSPARPAVRSLADLKKLADAM